MQLHKDIRIMKLCSWHSLYNTLQQQSLLLALKEILGYLLVISVVIAVVSRFIPFHKTIRVTFKRTGDDMV